MAKAKLSKIITPRFRLSYPHLFQKTEEKAGFKAQYEITMLFEKDEDISALRIPATKAADAMFGPKSKKPRPKGFKWPFKDGDKVQDQEAYAGMTYVKATSRNKPQVMGMDKALISEEDNESGERIKAGDYCVASLVVSAYDKGGGKGVAFYLNNIMKVKDGEAFSSRSSAEDDFGGVEADDSESDSDDGDSETDGPGF